MILTDVRLENYKQYAGVHEISIRDSGMVAVIGANGAGKTTLFEAIEWCLYKPTRIGRTTVLSRDGTGATRVTVHLEDPKTGARYVVDRRMVRSGKVDADVYLADQPETRLATGTGEVTAYVARHLIGLGHAAFLATFFTRQKELSFFGNAGPSERRRQVAGLLGHDAIEEAGKRMAEEARLATSDANAAAHLHQIESSGRNFEAELADASQRIAAASEALDAAELAHREAGAALRAVTDELDAAQALERRHLDLTGRIAEADGDRRVADGEEGNARGRIDDLERSAATRPEIAAIAALEPERVLVVAELEQERERERQRQQLSRDLDTLAASERRIAEDLRQTVASSGSEQTAPGWRIPAGDVSVPVEAARLLAIIDALPLDEALARDRGLRHCKEAMAARDQARLRESRLRDQADAAIRARAALLRDGDPRDALAAVKDRIEMLLREHDTLKERRQPLATDRQRFAERIEHLVEANFTDVCQTCFRPFTAEDAAHLVDRYREKIAELDPLVASLDDELARIRATGQEQRAEEGRIAQFVADLQAAEGRIATLTAEHERAGRELDAAEAAVRDALSAAGLPGEPDDRAIQLAAAHAAELTRIADARSAIERCLRDARQFGEDRERVLGEREALGQSRFDPAALQAAHAAVQESRDAAGRLRHIDEQLARRPAIEQQLRDAIARAQAAVQARQALEAERAALAFDPAKLAALRQQSDQALAAERAAGSAAHSAETELRIATMARESIVQAQERIAELAEAANRLQREADDLGMMRDGFKEFEKYVSSRVNPILSERTEEYLALVTGGTYRQVQFDSDYGLHVYDDDRPFPISEFSGGERDVAALCARLALSTVIGDQAAHPPGFVVLDEVFGSLDRERRALVLDTLRNLTGQDHVLRQLFVISHVEEVNSSPLVDEVWRVAVHDGVSKLEQDPRDGTISLEAAGALLLEEL